MAVFAITGPIFLILLLGSTATYFRLIARNETRILGVFVVRFALPALLFRALSATTLAEHMALEVSLGYAMGSLLTVGAGCLLLLKTLGFRSAAASSLGMALSNSAFIGFPIAEAFVGPSAIEMLAVYVSIENLLVVPLLLVLGEMDGGLRGRFWPILIGTLRRIATNPLILAIALGLAFRQTHLELPVVLKRAVDLLASASAPVALFYIGCVLSGVRLKGLGPGAFVVSLGKLVLHPALVYWSMTVLFPVDHRLMQAAVLNAGMPIATIYPLLANKFGREELSSVSLVLSTLMAFISLNLLLWLAGQKLF